MDNVVTKALKYLKMPIPLNSSQVKTAFWAEETIKYLYLVLVSKNFSYRS